MLCRIQTDSHACLDHIDRLFRNIVSILKRIRDPVLAEINLLPNVLNRQIRLCCLINYITLGAEEEDAHLIFILRIIDKQSANALAFKQRVRSDLHYLLQQRNRYPTSKIQLYTYTAAYILPIDIL
ncbi:hypothetical protein D3C76_822470 [compost metagenome]